MLRLAGLVLLLMSGVAAPAEADDGHAGKGTAIAAQQGAASEGPTLYVREAARPVQLSKALTAAPSPLWSTPAPESRRELASATVGLAGLPERRARDESPALPWISQGKSALRLPVTERLSLALGYRYLEAEDLWRYADAGSVDYGSHDFLLRAYWRF